LSTPARFRSQVFPTSQRFPGKFKFHGLISCRNRSWVSPFRVFPSRKIANLFRADQAPMQLSTSVPKRTTRDLIAFGFTDSHAFAQLPGSPADYGLTFRSPKWASRLPWISRRRTAPFRQLHLLRSRSPSHESVHNWFGFPLASRPILSWGFSL